MNNEELIKKAEFGKFKLEAIAVIKALEPEDMCILVAHHGNATICENCGKAHKGYRILAKADSKDMMAASELLAKKGVEQLLGIDSNEWGEHESN